MTRKEMVSAIYESLPEGKTSKLAIETILEAERKVMAAELLGGGEVIFQGVGKLKVKAVSARTGRNPRTGEKIEIPPCKRVFFSSFGDLKDALRG